MQHMTDEQYGQVMQSIGELKGRVDTGFLAITQRQDIANGRVSKNEGKIDLIEQQQAKADGRLTAYSLIFGVFITIVGLGSPFIIFALERIWR